MSTCIVVQYLVSLGKNIPCFPVYTVELWDDRMGICIMHKYLYNKVRHSLWRTKRSRNGIFVDF